MYRTLAILAVSTCLVSAMPAVAVAQESTPDRRIALVVGNGAYDALNDLSNAPSDAELVSEYFESLSYEVHTVIDGAFRELSDALVTVAGRADENTTIVFYFAGHGLQVGAANYLLPSDSRIDGLHDLPFAALSLSHVMSMLSARAEQAVFILDSCRDNPFLNQLVVDGLENDAKAIEVGFYFQRSPIDTFIAFSTSPGGLAFDGPPGGNSPFTSALVASAQANPGAEINTLMTRVRKDVHAATDGQQLPWETSSLTSALSLGDFTRAAFAQPAPLGAAAPGLEEATQPTGNSRSASLVIEGAFEREIPLGDRVAGTLPGESVVVVSDPIGGDLTVRDQGRLQVLHGGDIVPQEALSSLEFRPHTPRFSPVGLQSVTREGEFALAAAGQRLDVDMRLAIDRCDLEAGGVLDPQGVGAEIHPHEMRPLLALRACRDALARDEDNARFRVQYARALLALGDLDRARAELEASAQAGHIRATQRLGILEITSVAQTEGMIQQAAPDAAMDFLEAGHRLGDPLADYTLGRELMRYGTSDSELSRGYSLLTRAHSAGYLEAMNELGRYFLQEDGAHFNPERGLRYFEGTAARGNINGQNSLGVIYRNGLAGVAPDTSRAAREFEAAAKGGHPTAPNALGIFYEDGNGVAQSLDAALEWYDTGLSRGDPWGGANGALMILRQSPPGLTRIDAARRAGRAAALGGSEASQRARALLEQLEPSNLLGATQSLLNDLGAGLVVDGDFGAASRGALREVMGTQADDLSADQPLDLLLAVASAHWQSFGFRVDLL